MSKFEDHIYTCLVTLFSVKAITCQHYVSYNNVKLFFDFYIKSLNIFIECQGTQHDKFVQHFHGTLFKYRDARLRDRLKATYVESIGGVLICLDYDGYKKITPELLMEKIHDAYIK